MDVFSGSFSGMVEIVGTGVEETVYFWPDNDADKPYLELTGDDLWTSAASDPLVNVRNWKRKVSLTSGFTPRVAVMGLKLLMPSLQTKLSVSTG